ncbi:hypothetical protein EI94DRAFT_1711579 [Lactarius quietus]|nr:hypothetical protein EI94DRAFT_1711579 [Lactarius quietus]
MDGTVPMVKMGSKPVTDMHGCSMLVDRLFGKLHRALVHKLGSACSHPPALLPSGPLWAHPPHPPPIPPILLSCGTLHHRQWAACNPRGSLDTLLGKQADMWEQDQVLPSRDACNGKQALPAVWVWQAGPVEFAKQPVNQH